MTTNHQKHQTLKPIIRLNKSGSRKATVEFQLNYVPVSAAF